MGKAAKCGAGAPTAAPTGRWPCRRRRLWGRSVPTGIALAVALLSAMSGCNSTIRKQEDTVSGSVAKVAGSLEAMWGASGANDGNPGKSGDFAVRNPGPGNSAELRALGEIRLRSTTPLGLPQILNRLSDLSGLQFLILVGPESRVVAPDGSARAAAGSGSITAQPTVEPLTGGLDARYRPDHRGTLPELLDEIAARYGLSWRYDGTSVILRQFTVRTYRVAVLPSRTEYSATVGTAGTSGSIDLPDEIHSAVRSLAGPEAIVSFGRASGQFTITARPDNQRLVANYIRELNGFLGHQVAFDVNVLTVTLSEEEGVGVDIDLFAGQEDGDSVRWTGRHGISGSSGTVNVGVLSGDVDLKAFIGALGRRGRVSVETRTGATTSNNRLVPVQVVSETAYAKRVASVEGPEGTARTTIEPGTLTTGFELHLLPRVVPGGNILLRYSISLSDLNELVEFTSDRQTIQLPRVSTTSFEQQAIIGDNQTLVLMGFERSRRSHDRSASGGFPALFGGREAAASDRIATVLMIRPRILQQPGAAKREPELKERTDEG